jgi:hypothetical protein
LNTTVEALIDLRNRSLDDYLDGRISKETYRADLHAIAVEIDRILTPNGQPPLEERAARVVVEILADGQARRAAANSAKAARLEYWHRHHIERLRREDPEAYGAELLEEAALEAAEPDEVRMAQPILEALGDETVVRGAHKRVRAIAERPPTEADPARVPASVDVVWTDDDRLSWEELSGGVPCQGCVRPFLGDETSQRDGEPWPAYRERMKPIEAEFRPRHPDHGTSWTVGGGPSHCRRCCAPHPLSPEQIERINQIMSRPASVPAMVVPVRRCKTCSKPIEGDHVCQLEDLPKALRAVVEAVLDQERGRGR